MWTTITGWNVVAPICTLIIALAVAVTLGGASVNLPYEYTLARILYAVGFSILLARVSYWLAFERPDTESLSARLLATALIFGAIGVLWVASVMWVAEREYRSIERVKPKIKVAAYSSASRHVQQWLLKYPLQRYTVSISNDNVNSVSIFDFRMEFFFRNQIVKVSSMPLLTTGRSSVQLGGFSIHKQNKDGSISSYEEQPIETSITKKFSLVVQQDKINNKIINTNRAILDCERWPEQVVFTADIIIDLSSKANFARRGAANTYNGIYYYEISGRKYSEPIQGLIQEYELK